MPRSEFGERPPAIVLMLIAAGLAAAAGFFITLGRTPFIWQDEIDLASVAYSLATGGSGTPTTLADQPTFPFQLFYGPLFFQLGAVAFRLFGTYASSFRLVSLLGTLLVAAASVALLRTLGSSRAWCAAAFALVLWSPEAGNGATNGRMDTLAVGWQLAGLVALVTSFARPPGRWGLGWAVAGGVLCGLAALTTPRALPFLLAMALAAPLLLGGVSARTLVGRGGAAVAAAYGVVATWAMDAHITPIGWLRFVGQSGAVDRGNVSSSDRGLHYLRDLQYAAHEPQKALVSIACLLLAGLLLSDRSARQHRPMVRFVLAAAVLNVVLTFALFERSLDYAPYIALPLLAAVLLAAAHAGSPQREWTVAALVIAGALMAGVRVIKYAEVAESWTARDDGAFETFIRRHVPAGARLYSEEFSYFYAAERAGVHFRRYPAIEPESWVSGALETARREGRLETPPALSGPRFLLTSSLAGKRLEDIAHCFTSAPVAVVTPPATPAIGWLYRLPILNRRSWLRAYPAATLYRVPDDCRF